MGIDFAKYVGIPYKECDCWELAVDFYRNEFSVDLGHIVSMTPRSLQDREVLINTNKGIFEKVESPRVGDLVLIKFGGFETHIGIYAGTNRILHSLEGVGSVLDNLKRYKKLISGYYRHKVEND